MKGTAFLGFGSVRCGAFSLVTVGWRCMIGRVATVVVVAIAFDKATLVAVDAQERMM